MSEKYAWGFVEADFFLDWLFHFIAERVILWIFSWEFGSLQFNRIWGCRTHCNSIGLRAAELY